MKPGRWVRMWLVLLSIAVVSAGTGAVGLSPSEATSLIARVDRQVLPEQVEYVMIIRNYRPGRLPAENRTRSLRKGDKMAMVFLTPPSQKGQAFIRNGDDMWMYLPRANKVLRVGAKEFSLGGEASNADIMRVDLAADYEAEFLGQEIVEREDCYKLVLKAKRRTVAYDKVVYWISSGNELPVRREYYALSGQLLKVALYRSPRILGGQLRPSFTSVTNAVNEDYRTEITIEEMKIRTDLEDYIFNPSYAKRLL